MTQTQTQYITDQAPTSPIKFLGATVMSFNASLGFGSSPSTLTISLIEDCEANPPDACYVNLLDGDPNKVIVGDPVFFVAGTFVFGGILTGWNITNSASGRIYTINVSDPRELLNNTQVLFSSFIEGPYVSANYVNVYKYILYYNQKPICDNFPFTNNTDEGVPYNTIMEVMKEIQASSDPDLGPFVTSPTYNIARPQSRFAVDFDTFPGGAYSNFSFPEFFRLNGPYLPLLEILEAAKEAVGFEYYVYLEYGQPYHIIKIGLVDLRNPPPDFEQISAFVNSMGGTAHELSYGQELRNEPTRTIIIGDKKADMATTTSFLPFFGQELQFGIMKLVVPYGWDDFGFWIYKNTDSLVSSLTTTTGPLLAGVYQLSELDIRMAMSSFKSWFFWVFIAQAAGSFNYRVREIFPLTRFPQTDQLIAAIAGNIDAINGLGLWINQVTNTSNATRLAADFGNNPSRAHARANVPAIMEDLEKIQGWLSGLGNEYYGKQYLCTLDQGVCHYFTEYPVMTPDQQGDPVFSSYPTSSAWVDPSYTVIGLGDPYLEVFKDESGKLSGFAGFVADGRFTANN
jgi:hypothetical protein